MTILKIGDSPIKCYPVHTCHLSILTTVSNYEPWFYSNYIQIAAPEEFGSDPTKIIDFFNYDEISPFYNFSPFVSEIRAERVNDPDDILKSVFELLDNNYYIKLYVDDYYIPFRKQSRHNPHEIFIYGYSSDSCIFYVLGYNIYGNLMEETITFSELQQAYSSANKLIFSIFSKYKSSHWMHVNYFYKINIIHADIDFKHMIFLLESYLNSLPYEKMPYMICGLAVYDLVKKFYSFNFRKFIDIRPFHLLWEHKKVMFDRVSYLSAHYFKKDADYKQAFYDLQKDYFLLRNKIVKGNINNSHLEPELFSEHLNSLIAKESAMLDRLLKDLYPLVCN